MPETVAVDDLPNWRECRDCGLLQRLPQVPDGEAAICARCAAMLRRVATHGLLFGRVNAVAAAVLFVLALALPLGELHVLGRSDVTWVLSGPGMLRRDGLAILAVVVILTLVVMPAAKLLVTLTVLFGLRAARPHRWLAWLFGWLDLISPWAMLEVFLLGAVVAYSRLHAMAIVEVGLAALALGGAMVAMVATDATLDVEAIWQRLHGEPVAASLAGRSASAKLIGCTVCRLLAHADEGDRCPRCRHRLSSRKGHMGHAWALLLASACLYIPANVLPVMTVKRMGKGLPTTIAHGVIELAQAHLWPLALLVVTASIIIPLFKLLSLTVLLVMTRRRSSSRLLARTRLFRFVKFVGRWSMIDIFMLSVLVGVVRFGAISTVRPGMGAMAFCAVVLLTMGVTELFDPRLMWDAAGRDEQGVETPSAHPGRELSGAQV